MFSRKNREPSKLDRAIDEVFADMQPLNADDAQYGAMVDQLVKLYQLKDAEKPQRVSPDTLAIVSANLLGILVIVGHERAHILTSKAVSFVMKMR